VDERDSGPETLEWLHFDLVLAGEGSAEKEIIIIFTASIGLKETFHRSPNAEEPTTSGSIL
jgi:hypothetical protein